MSKFCIKIFLFLNFICKVYLLTCEITQKLNEYQTEYNFKDCIYEIEKNLADSKQELTELIVYHADQKMPNNEKIQINYFQNFIQFLPRCSKYLYKLEIVFDNPQFQINFEDLQYFIGVLEQLKQLRKLTFNFNNQNFQPSKGQENLLEKMFDYKNSKLIDHLYLGFQDSPLLFTDYSKVFQYLNLRTLKFNFGGQKNTKNVIQINPDTFKHMNFLYLLDISFPNTYEKYYENIFEVVNQYTNLSQFSIDLSYNTIGDIFTELKLPQLETLFLFFPNCQLKENYFKKLENFLSELDKLQSFGINLNQINQEFVLKTVSNALSNKKNLSNLQEVAILNQGNTSSTIFQIIHKPFTSMFNLKKLIFDFYIQDTNICPSFDKFDEIFLGKLQLTDLIIHQNLSECAKSEDNYTNYEQFYNGIYHLFSLEFLEIEIIADSKFTKILSKNTKLKNIDSVIYTTVKKTADNIKNLFQGQQNLENIKIKWNLLAQDKSYPIIDQNDNFYQGMEQLFTSGYKNIEELNIEFLFMDQFQNKSFDISFLKNMIYKLENLNNLNIQIQNIHPLQLNLDFFNQSLEKMRLRLEQFKLVVKNQDGQSNNLEIKNIDFMSEIFNTTYHYFNLQEIFIQIEQQNFLNFESIQNAFKNVELKKLTLILNNGHFNEILQKTQINSKKLQQVQLCLNNNQDKNLEPFNSIVKPWYNTVTSFYLSDSSQIDQSKIINLTYLKQQNQRLYFEEKEKVIVQNCEDFNSPCQDCNQNAGQCKSCLFNFVAPDCNECGSLAYFQENIQQCVNCQNNDEYCIECDEGGCLACEQGFILKGECIEQQDDENNDGLIIGLSVGGVVIIISIIGVIFYIRKRKISRFQQDIQTDQQQLIINNQ